MSALASVVTFSTTGSTPADAYARYREQITKEQS